MRRYTLLTALIVLLLAACGGDDETAASTTITTAAETTTTEATTTTVGADRFDSMPAFRFSVQEAAERYNAAAFSLVADLTTTEQEPGVFGNELSPVIRVVLLGPSEVDLVRGAIVVISTEGGGAEFPQATLSAAVHALAPITPGESTTLVEANLSPVVANVGRITEQVPLNDDIMAWVVASTGELRIVFLPPGSSLPLGVNDL